MRDIDSDSVDCIVTDPPYFLINNSGSGFMGKSWDSLYGSKRNSILCKSKEFAVFVTNFFSLMEIESSMEEESFVQESANTDGIQEIKEKRLLAPVQSVEKSSPEVSHTSKVNINSVQGIVLTKDEVMDLLNGLSLTPTTLSKSLKGNALFVVPVSHIKKLLKNIVQENVLKSSIKEIWVDQEIRVTLMEEAKIHGSIEAIIGMRCENNAMKEMDMYANSVTNIVEEKKYKHIILNHTNKEELINYLISLLYALFVMPELSKSQSSSLKEIINTNLIYHFHKNWAISALRVLKPGAFMFVMCAPRSDILSSTIIAIRDAGFNVAFSSIYWAYASGFPKAQNVSKQIDKRAGAERKVIAIDKIAAEKANKTKFNQNTAVTPGNIGINTKEFSKHAGEISVSATPLAKQFDGAYSGMQLKPATEIIIVAMKPLSEKTYVDQALQNGHGCTWLDNCRIPYENDSDKEKSLKNANCNRQPKLGSFQCSNELIPDKTNIKKGRFPANVLCEDDVLNDGRERISKWGKCVPGKEYMGRGTQEEWIAPRDSGSFSRYFSLDAWWAERIKQLPEEAQKTFPFMIVPKASKSEKNRGLEDMANKEIYTKGHGNQEEDDVTKRFRTITKNSHTTVKPIKLMSWLITLGTREGDKVLDPFVGSGTTCIAAAMLNREYIGIEKEAEYVEIARKRISAIPTNLSRF